MSSRVAGLLKDRRSGRLRERDRLLLGVLAVCRILTTDQVHRLFRGGKDEDYTRKRLGALAGARKSALPGPPLLERLAFYRLDRSTVDAWGLTPEGVLAASAAGLEDARLFGSEFGVEFLDHTTSLNEVFVRLAIPHVAAGLSVSQLPFRWSPPDSVRLPWAQYDMDVSKTVNRLLIPDGVLELPERRRRVFLEAESGAHAIASARHDKPGATLAKLERYEEFFTGFADSAKRVTFCAEAFPDGFAAEVIFLVRNSGRRDNVNAAIAGWRAGRAGVQIRARAMIIDDVEKEFAALLPPPASVPAPARLAASPVAVAPPYSAEQVRTLRHFMREVLSELDAANKAANRSSPPGVAKLAREAAAVLQHLQKCLS